VTDPAKFTPTERRQYDAACRHRHIIREFLNGHDNDKPKHPLSETVLADLIRRAREPATDAYAQGEGGRGNDISNPTLAAVTRHAGARNDQDTDLWDEPDDHVRAAILEVLGALAEAAGIIRLADKRLAFINTIPTGRINSLAGECQACQRPVAGGTADPLRSGYCNACRMAWDRAGKPDRPTFERERREKQAS
jgi:hypothetical protein